MNHSTGNRRRNAAARRRLGYTLLEIMTSVTLALMLMYSVAKIFSRVGGAMNETMSTMEMNNSLRNAKNRLTADLEALSVTPAPPRNSRMNEGYLCYVEGMGGPFDRVVAGNSGMPFSTADIALDTERYEANYNNGSDPTDYNADNTVGDLDDILSFTAKAPDGQPFRGRYIKPIYDDVGNIVCAKKSTFESQYAEIVWFVRGTTLYRRVLPLMSNDMLQESFEALKTAVKALDDPATPDLILKLCDPDLSNVAYDNIAKGYGFFFFYDVSVHLGYNGRLVANSLGDLTNRENRYFYWNSCGLHLHPDASALNPIKPAAFHGANDAWYWLRMATLQESAAPNFRAGAPYGQDFFARDSILARNDATYGGWARTIYGAAANVTTDPITNYWLGLNQVLSVDISDPLPNLPTNEYAANTLPRPKSPFIDFWKAPNVWKEVNYETGDLNSTASDFAQNSNNPDKAFNQDVVLTNVVSFNVKVWDPTWNAYIDLGSGVQNDGQLHFPDKSTSPNIYNSNELSSFGYYGNPNLGSVSDHGVTIPGKNPWLPCVYDTWSEQYQRDLFVFDDNRKETNASGALADVNSDGEISAAQLQDYPPPYNTRIKSLQIEIRVFDPRSKTIRNNTFNVDLSTI